jgi:hypothetical protein
MQYVRLRINQPEHRAAKDDPGHELAKDGRLANALLCFQP